MNTDQNSIEAGNRLIAEFHGMKRYVTNNIVSYEWKGDFNKPDGPFTRSGSYNYMQHYWYWFEYQLEYHSSWDWLMPSWIKLKAAIAEGGYMKRRFYFYQDWYSKICDAILGVEILEAHRLIVLGIESLTALNSEKEVKASVATKPNSNSQS